VNQGQWWSLFILLSQIIMLLTVIVHNLIAIRDELRKRSK
jgi:hypothetical protein